MSEMMSKRFWTWDSNARDRIEIIKVAALELATPMVNTCSQSDEHLPALLCPVANAHYTLHI